MGLVSLSRHSPTDDRPPYLGQGRLPVHHGILAAVVDPSPCFHSSPSVRDGSTGSRQSAAVLTAGSGRLPTYLGT